MSDDRLAILEAEIYKLKGDREREQSNAAALNEAKDELQMRAPKLPEWLERKEARLAREAQERAQALEEEDRRREQHLESVRPETDRLLAATAAVEERTTAARRRHAHELIALQREGLELARELGDVQKVPPIEEKAKPSKLRTLVGSER